jgi:class 3 adenylate cyclase/tetratricopeptide (TPR) repeat protein
MVICPQCGQENPEGFRLCGMCGAPLEGSTSERYETRKVVTILFGDIAGSTSLGERLDPESLRRVMDRYFDSTRAAIERHGGTVEKFIGDAVMAVFGIPVVHEDDALRATRAAVEMREALTGLNAELEQTYGVRIERRTGISTGEVVAAESTTGDRLATGDAVNVAARLEQAASPGEILVDGATFHLIRDAVDAEAVGSVSLRGRERPVSAHRVLGVEADRLGHERRMDTRLVGRERELDLLHDAFQRTVRGRSCHLFTLLGAPGVGKSRLVAEFLGEVTAEACVARGRCLPYGEGIAYHPVVEAVHEALGVADTAAVQPRLVELLAHEPDAETITGRLLEALSLAEGTASREELFWAVRKVFEATARRQPLVLVFDDAHWGEATFLDLVEHVSDWSRDAPMLVLCMARPDLLDRRSGWSGGKLNATTVLLEPLDEAEADALVVDLLSDAELDAMVRARITAAADGNPLFVQELVAMLIDDGLLTRENGRWSATADVGSLPVPPSIRALLAARLDQLGAGERIVIERAAVEGQVFHQGAVAALAPESPPIGSTLMALVRRELIRPERPVFQGQEAFRFRHLLIRDAAYDALPKEARAGLHVRFADWLERTAGPRAREFADIAGYHLDQAWRYRRELSPGEPHEQLAHRAGDRLASAGRRAVSQGDIASSANLLERAAELLPGESQERLELLPDLASALAESGRLAEARAVLAEARDLARVSGNRRIEWRSVAADVWWQQDTAMEPDLDIEDLEQLTRRAIAELEELQDDLGLAAAWKSMSDIENARGNGVAWIDALSRAFEHARHAGNRPEEWACLTILGGAMFFGPTPTDEAIARLEAIRDEVGDDLLLESAIARPLGGLIGLQGRLDDGRTLIERSRSIFVELGLAWGLAGIAFMSGRVAFLAGDLETAAEQYRSGIDAFARMGERGRQSSMIAELGRVELERGRLDEAERLAREAGELAWEHDIQPQIAVLDIRGSVLARRGRTEEGERLVRQALELVESTDFLDQHALVLISLAEVVTHAGRREEADGYLNQALELAWRKKNALVERRVAARLERLRRSSDA